MKKIYIDSDFKCHITNDGTLQEVETAFFDGKCDALIEGYRFVPSGENWMRPDGTVFQGEMITPWKDIRILLAYQEQYEAMAIDAETIEKAAAYDVLTKGDSA